MAPPHDLAGGLLDGSTAPSSILSSLPSADDSSSATADLWINFLHHDDEDEFELRDAFLLHLISNPSAESFAVLARLIAVHSAAACSVKKWSGPLLFGQEFITQISQHITSLGLPASTELLTALLSPNRPRNEHCQEIRDMLLVLSKSHPVELGELLIDSVVTSVMQIDDGDEEEVAMKRETAALSKLQDFREIIEAVAKHCVRCLKDGSGEGDRIVDAFGQLYDIAAYAFESQLETLLDGDAALILDQFNKAEQEEEMEVEETKEELAPLYTGLTQGPLKLTGGQLEVALEEIAEKLSITDSDQWNGRLGALVDLERILASGLEDEDRYVFIERLRKMPMPDQLADLRSQLTQAACRVLICASFEYRVFIEEDSTLSSALQQFIENCLPALMKLCTSGTRLMANQGVTCLQTLCATSTGHPKLLNILCDDIVDKKVKNNNRKRGAVMGLTAALRVWDESCFKNVDLIAKAVKEANSNRDPGVREEGRKAYWAMESCRKTNTKSKELYGERSREYRNLLKCRAEVDAEWDEDGRMIYLLNWGVLLEENAGKSSASSGCPSTAPPGVNPNKRPAGVTKDRAGASKASRLSTPAKYASEAAVKRPSSANLPMQTQTPSSKRTTFAPSSTARSSALKAPSVNARQTESSSMKVDRRPNQTAHKPTEIYNEKENAPTTPVSRSSPKSGTPVVSLLARPSPLSIEKCRSRNALKQVVAMLSDTSNESEQFLGIQVLALFAKDHSDHESWNSMFGVVLELLLGECVSCLKIMSIDDSLIHHLRNFYGIGLANNAQSDDGLHFARSPSKKLESTHEAQQLYLQGIRSLLQFVPNRFEESQVKDVMTCLLEVSNHSTHHFCLAFTDHTFLCLKSLPRLLHSKSFLHVNVLLKILSNTPAQICVLNAYFLTYIMSKLI